MEGRKQGKRWVRWTFGVTVVLLVGIVALPWWLPSFLLPKVLAAIDANTRGTTTIERMTLGWSGKATLQGIRVADATGASKIRLKELRADVDLSALVSGRISGAVVLDGLAVDAALDPQGGIDIAGLWKSETARTKSAPSPSMDPSTVDVAWKVVDGTLSYTTPTGAGTRIERFAVDGSMKGADLAFKAGWVVAGAPWAVDGTARLAGGATKGTLRYEIATTPLKGVEALVGSFAGLDTMEGTLSGAGDLRFALPFGLEGQGTLDVKAFRASGTATAGRVMAIPDFAVRVDGKSDGPVASWKASIDMRDVVRTTVDVSREPSDGGERVNATYALDGDVARLIATTSALIGTKDGVRARGRLVSQGSATAVLKGNTLERATYAMTLGGTGIDVTAPNGRSLRGLADVKADLAASQEGALLTISKGIVSVGATSATLAGTVNLASRAIPEARIVATGDLDVLMAEVRQLAEIPWSLAGTFKVDASLVDGKAFEATVETRRLVVGRHGDVVGPIDLDVGASGTVRLGESPEVDIPALTLRGAGAAIEGAMSWKSDTTAIRAKGSVRPSTLAKTLGRVAKDVSMSDAPVRLDVDAVWEAVAGRERLVFKSGRIEAPSTTVTATGTLQAASQGPSDLVIDAESDIGRLVADLGSLLPTGRSKAAGKMRTRWVAKGDAASAGLSGTLTVDDLDVTFVDGAGTSYRFDEPRLAASAESAIDLASRTADIRRWALSATGITLEGDARVGSAQQHVAAKGNIDVGRVIAAYPMLVPKGVACDARVHVATEIDVGLDGRSAKGTLTASDLAIVMPASGDVPSRTFRDPSLRCTFDVAASGADTSGALRVNAFSVVSSHAQIDAKGVLDGELSRPSDFTLRAVAQVKPLLDQLAIGSAGGATTSGVLTVDGVVRTRSGALDIDLKPVITDFVVEVPAAQGRKAIRIVDPAVRGTFKGLLSGSGADLTIEACSLASTFADAEVRGSIRDLRREPRCESVDVKLAYDPVKVGAILAAFTDVVVSGEGRRSVTARFDGPLSTVDPASLFRIGVGETKIAVAPMSKGGMTFDGDLASTWKKGVLDANGDFRFNGGPLKVTSKLGFNPEAKSSTFRAELQGARATGDIAPIASLVNPIFAVTGDPGTSLSGMIDAVVDLTISGPLTEADLNGGWDGFPKERIDGTGTVALSAGTVQGSTLILKLADLLLGGGASEVSMEPVRFTIRKGRLSYDKPLRMSVKGLQMVWTGTVGLDRTLDLKLDIVVNDALRARIPFLNKLAVDTVSMPVRGTTARPDVDLGSVLADLAKQAAIGSLGGNLGGVLGGILGGRDSKPAPPPKTDPPAPTDPARRPTTEPPSPFPFPFPAPKPRTAPPPETRRETTPVTPAPASRPAPASQPTPPKKRRLFDRG